MELTETPVTAGPVATRVATALDCARVAETITAAFHNDPVWGWAFPDPEQRPAQLTIWWRFFITSALRYQWVWITEGCEAAAVWIPPGGTELAAADEERAGPLLAELLGDWSETVYHALERFESAHPRHEPHFYLSLLGSHPDHRGRGIGMALLADNLARIDAEHMPAYLESSNPANNARYERAGFMPHGQFAVTDGGPVVTTMWRSAR